MPTVDLLAPAGTAAPTIGDATRRVVWIDAARGIGIVLVVAGHNPGLWAAAPTLGHLIFAFHMPLFFAIAGTTLSRRSTWRSAWLRAAALWLSYLALCLLSLPLALRRSDHESLLQTLLGIVYGTGHTIVIPPLWFLPCLAVTLLAVQGIDSLRTRWPAAAAAPGRSDALCALACGALGVGLLALQGAPSLEPRLGWGTLANAGAPLNVDLVPIGAAFVFFGRLLKDGLRAPMTRSVVLWGWALACAAAFALLFVQLAPRLDLNLRVVVPGFITLVVAALGCAATLLVARALDHTRAGALAAALGTKTLVILWLHAGIEKRAWETLGAVMPTVPAIAAALLIALLVPYAIDHALTRVPQLRGVIYPQAWLAGGRAGPR